MKRLACRRLACAAVLMTFAEQGPSALAQIGQLQAVAPSAPSNDPAPAPPSAAQAPVDSVGGMGDINLYPKRVVIDDHNRVASIGLYNRTTNTGDYDITLTDMMMTSDGRLIDLSSVTDPAESAKVHAASALLRYSPHRVTLPGSESQMVRIMAHVPPDLPPGEYRAHFAAIAIPPQDAGLSIQQASGQGQNSGIGVHIIPRFGISIPVIVRVGETTLNVGLTDIALIALPDGSRGIAFTITREGTRSAFGDVTVTAPGIKAPVVQVKGLGVYTEIAMRQVKLAIDPKVGPIAPGTRLTLTYTDDDVNPGKVLARQEFTVP